MDQDELTFVDTNVLVYAHDRTEADKQLVAQSLLSSLWSNRTGVLSSQVLQEFYVVATRKLSSPMSPRTAREIVGLYSEWPLVLVDVPLILTASRLEEEHSLSFWDALIVEAASRAGASRLVSEDMQSGQTIVGVRIENPFRGRDQRHAP